MLDRSVEVDTWPMYFYTSGYTNLGRYFKDNYATDPNMMFCAEAAQGWINNDPGHHGWNKTDYVANGSWPNIFTGSYRAGSYEPRTCSAPYDSSILVNNDDNWVWNNPTAPTAGLKFRQRHSFATSQTAMIVDTYSYAYIASYTPKVNTIGHDYTINRLFGDGSAEGKDYRGTVLLTGTYYGGNTQWTTYLDR